MGTPRRSARVAQQGISSFKTSQLITVLVGSDPNPEHGTLTAHEGFLKSNSEYFKRSLNGRWKESEDRVVKLPDDRPEIFDQYLQSAYTRTFKLEEKTKDELVKLTSQEYHHYISHAYDQLFGVYVLAEKFQNTSAKNKAITAIFERTHFKHEQDKLNSSRVPSPLVANMVYDATPVGSPARRLVAELFGTVHTTIPMRIFARSRLCADLVDDAFALAGDMQQLKNAVQGKLCLSKNVEDYLE